jgi:hypothetical protein
MDALACLSSGDPGTDAMAVQFIDCATQAHCRGIDCYCGGADLNLCERYPRGSCITEAQALAGTSDAVQVLVAATNSNTPLSRAARLLSCRTTHCSSVCGL